MPNYKEDYKHYKAELAKVEPTYLGLIEIVKGLERLVNLETGGSKRGFNDAVQVVAEPGSFKDMSLKETALKCLWMANPHAMPTKQMTQIIEGAGFKHTSKNLWNTLNTTLDRLDKKDKLVTKTDEGWKLTNAGIARFQPLQLNLQP